ncbi:response regulator [Blastopirellula sp. JC732]|uniref:Response regulator n=1 Tax=Blastopirellula sediminis TaxID=2894196 RepID=A0A9X1MSH4_9BACT|nr:HD domain-containing phosphohydrolase [Blastopirellula sediminis]MCC9605020.1 response regulator [Blastopirellula sediminis]MCC9631680.1 response regulator [Blastopirellula sediminis]
MNAVEPAANILIVDDDEISLDLLRYALEAQNFQVWSASNGAEALRVLEEQNINLVVTDWEMPIVNGLEFCREVRRRQSDHYVYVILLTSHGARDEIVEGMAAGADDFIVKPFNPPELLARIQAGRRVLALETRDLVIFALARLAESRDTDTGQHLERVRLYSRRLAEELAASSAFADEIDAEFIRLVFQTSPLHDIGKVGIPDAVLLKPGKLTDEEFEIMKRHTIIGAETLDAALSQFPHARFLQVARDIAIGHHERWNGQGYPYGISGEQIPLAARIVAVADVYDALTTRRVYKDAMPHEQAEAMILAEVGEHFDPVIVAAFQRCGPEFVRISQRYANLNEPAACGV